jgi:hypothetical protein
MLVVIEHDFHADPHETGHATVQFIASDKPVEVSDAFGKLLLDKRLARVVSAPVESHE